MLLPQRPADSPARVHIRMLHDLDEDGLADGLVVAARLPPDLIARVAAEAERLVEGVRRRKSSGDLDAFLRQFRLSTQEGVVLMCLAEALLRIPDSDTADRLIRDKVVPADWAGHLGKSDSAFVNASTWALMLSGRLLRLDAEPMGVFARLLSRAGEPLVREALIQAVRIMGRQFVMGRTIGEALDRARGQKPYRHSFDMLGEAARTGLDAQRYMDAYTEAIAAIGAEAKGRGPVAGPGISIKLSALHPRYEYAQRDRVMAELLPRLKDLTRLAKEVDIGLTVDAEECERLELSLDVIEAVFRDPALEGWDGFGMAVQAYQKRARAVIAWAEDLARGQGRRLAVRLVKGAYWDAEIKRAQERGLAAYPVFTRKVATDVSYLACARDLFAAGGHLFPAFATHNAHTIAAIRALSAGRGGWEFQRLHGMGEALYSQVVAENPCRVYAPVGSHEDLLPYLVRRLLENGANTSFVNRLADETVPVAKIVTDPVETYSALTVKANPGISPPPALFAPERHNSHGWDLGDPQALEDLRAAVGAAASTEFLAAPVIGGQEILAGPEARVLDPADCRRVVGRCMDAAPDDIKRAVNLAVDACGAWDRLGGAARAAILDRAADLYEQAAARLIVLAIREAGKTIPDALAEVREAVDFLRYYAARARAEFSDPSILRGVTGETNALSLHGRGVFACISPWNFPLAIFTGQVAAALAAGNAVVAKPAEQTPLMAAQAVRLLHEAGVPAAVLSLLPGDGRVGQSLVDHPGIAGVAFTGSDAVARGIARSLAARSGPIAPLIAETGGINAMIVDSTALAEQVVADVLASAFGSAGQRCSALRMLFVQDDMAPKLLSMLAGAMEELRVGDPAALSTDIGPIIDSQACESLEVHAARMAEKGRLLARCPLPPEARHGHFFAPRAWVVEDAGTLDREVFGPCLHIARYEANRLDDVLRWISSTGYGLTLGIHSRIDSFSERIYANVRVGNIYVNRGMTGAVVGAQPFGGEGLSGTGPKAGGPHTLIRYATERVRTVNTVASGGNAALLSGESED